MAHLVADLDGMWVPCDCGAGRDHDHPDMAEDPQRTACVA